MSERSLRWWKWQIGSTLRDAQVAERTAKPSSAGVTPLTFVEMTGAVRCEPFEVVLIGGIRIRVPSDFDVPAMERLLDLLERRR